LIDNSQIKGIFSSCGMPLCGVTSFFDGFFRKAGRKEALYEHIREPKSLIIAALPYFSKRTPNENIAKFAAVPDYMKVFGRKLECAKAKLGEIYPRNIFYPICNIDPLAEVRIAEQAGLGTRGCHNLLITPEYGSYIVLGQIATDLEIEPTRPLTGSLCLKCGACVKACPGGALDGEGGFDRHRCLSHINQKNGELEPWQKEIIIKNNRLWGCDICQDACPLNKNAKTSFVPEFTDEDKRLSRLTSKDVKEMSKEQFAERYADRVFLSKNPENIWRNLKWF
jgi:epoxyqueuosine reductase